MKSKIGLYTASSIVIANMIGTGVFTSLGLQLTTIQNTYSILLLWVIGGLLSLFGAFAYAELGTHFKESGGDYIYLSRVFHPLLGYLSAWAGLTIGFSAPVALASMAFTKYLSPFGIVNNSWVSVAIIILIGLMHSFSIKQSGRFQNGSTLVKILFIISLISLGAFSHKNGLTALNYSMSWHNEILKPDFAVSMVYVSFAYTGWNAAAYIVDEIYNPRVNLPKALIGSTFFVAFVYILFQYILLKNASMNQLFGKIEVTSIAFENILGIAGGNWVGIFISIQLIATVSSYLWVGPRVTMAMAKENKLWQTLALQNKHGIPVAALWMHVLISILLTLTGSFEKVLLYSGFILQLMASLTVAASLFIKDKKPHTFTSPFKPWPQIVFLLFNSWVLVFTIIQRPIESFIGIGILCFGVVIYFFDTPTLSKVKELD